MANPIIKIKTSTTQFPPDYDESTGRGLTFGELGARIGTNLNGLYIGGTGPKAIRIGSEVSDDNSLANNSPFFIPTQRSVRSYVNNSINSINLSAPFIISRYISSDLNFPVTVQTAGSFRGVRTIGWDAVDFTSGTSGLIFIQDDGTFTNSGDNQELIGYSGAFARGNGLPPVRLNVTYQLMWSQAITEFPATMALQKTQWIETYYKTGTNTIEQTGTYGFSTCIVTPVLDITNNVYDGIINASCSFTLRENERFIVKAWNNDGSATKILASNQLVPSKATRIQIVGI